MPAQAGSGPNQAAQLRAVVLPTTHYPCRHSKSHDRRVDLWPTVAMTKDGYGHASCNHGYCKTDPSTSKRYR